MILFYSYCKRFTALSHLVLGLALGIAPVGAYIAVTGAFSWPPCILSLLVVSWCAGFDVIYALQDEAHDRRVGLHSIPARLGARKALVVSALFHFMSLVSLGCFAAFCPPSPWLWAGVGIFSGLLILQHFLVTPTRQRRIGIAFGTLNGLASLSLAVCVLMDFFLSLPR